MEKYYCLRPIKSLLSPLLYSRFSAFLALLALKTCVPLLQVLPKSIMIRDSSRQASDGDDHAEQ